jgi:LmbE family N-acetylglucosaminyl deacetylase
MRILCVYAHPDDEAFGPSSILAKYARRGAGIYAVYFTRGEHGNTSVEPKPGADELARLREQDLREVAALIGLEDVELHNYGDGSLDQVPQQELEQHVLNAIRRYLPEIIVTFGPGGITRHADHIAAHRAATAAFYRARAAGLGPRELYYDALSPDRAQQLGVSELPDGQPNTWIDVRETWPVKFEALRRHGRHVADAGDRAAEFAGAPILVEALHRAWPEVAPGQVLTELGHGAPP